MLWKCCTQYVSKFRKLSMATGLEKVSFHSNPKECSNYCTALISHASKVMLKIFQARLHWYVNWEHPDIQAGFRKGRGTKIKLPTSFGSQKKQENSRKTSTSASLTMLKPLTVDHNKLWKILQEMAIPDHLTCLLRNLYADQEATAGTRHGTTDWFQIGKGVCQGCILSASLFNFYAEYIMQNAGLYCCKKYQ